MIEDALSFLGLIAGLVFALGGAIVVCVALWASYPGPKSCEAFGEGMKLKTEYRFWYGCFVTMPDGRVLPEDIATKVMGQKYGVEMTSK